MIGRTYCPPKSIYLAADAILPLLLILMPDTCSNGNMDDIKSKYVDKLCWMLMVLCDGHTCCFVKGAMMALKLNKSKR